MLLCAEYIKTIHARKTIAHAQCGGNYSDQKHGDAHADHCTGSTSDHLDLITEELLFDRSYSVGRAVEGDEAERADLVLGFVALEPYQRH